MARTRKCYGRTDVHVANLLETIWNVNYYQYDNIANSMDELPFLNTYECIFPRKVKFKFNLIYK